MDALTAFHRRGRWPLDYVNITRRFDREVAVRERLRVLGESACAGWQRVIEGGSK